MTSYFDEMYGGDCPNVPYSNAWVIVDLTLQTFYRFDQQ